MNLLREAAQQALEFLDAEFGWSPGEAPRIDALRAALAQQAEPVAWLQPKTVDGHLRPDLGYETCSKDDYGAFPVYTAPPQRKPLTEAEIDRLWRDPQQGYWDYRKFARAVERKVRGE